MTNDPTSAAYEELKQKLADIEHQRWSDWQAWMHSKLIERVPFDGWYQLSAELVKRWDKQIATPYSELSEQEQASDMEQVDRYWPLIEQAIAEAERRGRIDELKNTREGFVMGYQRYEGNEHADVFLKTVITAFDERLQSLQANADGANGRTGENTQ